jgi:hypothetical protein
MSETETAGAPTAPVTVKLFARPGLHTLHIDQHRLVVDEDGQVDVPVEHTETALSLGCSRTPHAPHAPKGALQDRIAELEERLELLETTVAELGKKKR